MVGVCASLESAACRSGRELVSIYEHNYGSARNLPSSYPCVFGMLEAYVHLLEMFLEGVIAWA